MRSTVQLTLITVFLGGLLSTTGCSPPQVEPENLHLIASLRTAISAKNTDWLEKNADMIQERRSSGKMGKEEYEAFRAILEKARSGDWSAAEKQALAFQKAQRPTEHQKERVRQYWEE